MAKRPRWFALLVGLACALAASPIGAAGAAAGGAEDASGFGRAAGTAYALGATDYEARLFLRTNARRVRIGCPPLRLDPALVLAARQHSAHMAAEGELSHRLGDEAGLPARVVSAGYTHWRLLAENLAWGQATPAQVFTDWVHSAGHRANLDNCRLRDVGLGVVVRNGRPWVTEDFGRRTG